MTISMASILGISRAGVVEAAAAEAPAGAIRPSDAVFVTTKQGDTVARIYRAAQSLTPHYCGEDRILLANSDLVGYSYNDPLPAGLRVQVAGDAGRLWGGHSRDTKRLVPLYDEPPGALEYGSQ